MPPLVDALLDVADSPDGPEAPELIQLTAMIRGRHGYDPESIGESVARALSDGQS